MEYLLGFLAGPFFGVCSSGHRSASKLVFVRRKNGSDVIVLLGQQKCKRLLRSA